ncbi:MAG: GNAT family N-acetyltransferase [Acidobacteriota bacterium]
MIILTTDRLVVRELDPGIHSEFVNELLNTPKFIKYIGDRGVRSAEQAADIIRDRYIRSYRENGYGLYAVERKTDSIPIGICGFVKRDTLPEPDLGFAFLPGSEGHGFGFESSRAILQYGRRTLGINTVLAITSQDNEVSCKLLVKLGFQFIGLIEMPDAEKLRLYENRVNKTS